MRAIARDNREGQVVPLSSALDRVAGGADVLAAVQRTREEIRRREAKARAALDIIVKQFALDASSPILQAALNFVSEWEKKKVNKTIELEELVDYLGVLPRSRRRDSPGSPRQRERRPPHDRARRQGTGISPRLHSAREFELIPLLPTRRRWSPSPANCAMPVPSPKPTIRRSTSRKSAACSTSP